MPKSAEFLRYSQRRKIVLLTELIDCNMQSFVLLLPFLHHDILFVNYLTDPNLTKNELNMLSNNQ